MPDTPSANINWIASYPRSGNIWVRMFLYQSMAQLDILPGDEVTLNDVARFIPSDISDVFYQNVFGHDGASVAEDEQSEARLKVQSYFSQMAGGQVFVKTHAANGVIGGYPTLHPDLSLRGIYIVRNPLDVAVSYAAFLRTSLDNVVQVMNAPNFLNRNFVGRAPDPMGSWSQNVESWGTVQNYPILILRYEDMLADAAAEFAKVKAFLGLELSETQFDAAVAASGFEAMVANEKKNGFAEKPPTVESFFRNGGADQWQKVLSSVQVRALVRAHAREMNRHGYLTSQALDFAKISKADALKASQAMRKAARGAA